MLQPGQENFCLGKEFSMDREEEGVLQPEFAGVSRSAVQASQRGASCGLIAVRTECSRRIVVCGSRERRVKRPSCAFSVSETICDCSWDSVEAGFEVLASAVLFR